MYPLNDNDLDRLSREAAEHYDVESSATGWEVLEKRLDREIPHKEDKDRRRFLFWLFFIAVMTGGTLFWMLNGTPSKDSIAQKKEQNSLVSPSNTNAGKSNPGNTAAVDTKTDGSATQKEINDSKESIAGKQKENGNTDKTNTSTISINSNTTNTTLASTAIKNKRTISSPNRNNNRPSALIAGRTAKPVTEKTGNKSVVKDDNNKDVDNVNTDDGKSIADGNKDAGQPVTTAPATTDKVAEKPDDKTKEEAKPVTEAAAPKKASITAKKSNKGFELGIAVGPDLTNVKFKYFAQAGYIAGLQIGYRFNNRWSVNTGLFYTKKNYEAAGEDFTPPKHYWTQYVKLDKVDGNCSMWEVPLNVRYDFSTGKQQRWFASTGLSTYFMTHQYYDYYYYNQMGVLIKSNPWYSDSTYNHLFSIVNLSAGYERSIGSGFSIQAEPYLKLPLKGLGFGELKMESYGILFSLKYKLFSHNQSQANGR